MFLLVFYQSLIILIQSINCKFSHMGLWILGYGHETLKFSVKVIALISIVSFDNSQQEVFFPVYFIAKEYLNSDFKSAWKHVLNLKTPFSWECSRLCC